MLLARALSEWAILTEQNPSKKLEDLELAKKAIALSRLINTESEYNKGYNDGLSLAVEKMEELEKSVGEKIIELEGACSSAPQEYWSDYDNRIKQLKEVLGEE